MNRAARAASRLVRNGLRQEARYRKPFHSTKKFPKSQRHRASTFPLWKVRTCLIWPSSFPKHKRVPDQGQEAGARSKEQGARSAPLFLPGVSGNTLIAYTLPSSVPVKLALPGLPQISSPIPLPIYPTLHIFPMLPPRQFLSSQPAWSLQSWQQVVCTLTRRTRPR